MKRALYIQRGVLAKEYTGWIDEPEVGTFNLRAQQTIDKRLAASYDSTDDIVNGRRSREGRTLAGVDVIERCIIRIILSSLSLLPRKTTESDPVFYVVA
jgi:hypothetical protein